MKCDFSMFLWLFHSQRFSLVRIYLLLSHLSFLQIWSHKVYYFFKKWEKQFWQQMSALCTTFLYMYINHYSISIKSSKNKTLFQISVHQKMFALLRAEEKKIIFFETLLFTLCIILRNSSSFIKILKEDRITFLLISNILKCLNRGWWILSALFL